MALVDRVVAHGLPGEVVGDRVHLEAVLLQDVAAPGDVGVVLDGGPRVEVVAPARDLQPVVAPLPREPGHLLERQVGPLAGEQGDGSGHQSMLLDGRASCCPLAADRATASSTQLHLQPVGERRAGVGARGEVAHQVDDLVGERVLVAQAVPGRPPRADVRVGRLGDQDAAETRGFGVVGAVEERQLVHRLEVEHQRARAAVDLQAHRVLAPGREPGGLEARHRAPGEPAEEQCSVVDVDSRRGRPRRRPTARSKRPAAGARARTSPSAPRRPSRPVAGDELRHVDDVRADVAQRARARTVLLQPPDQRELRVDDPVLQVLRADVADVPIRPSATSRRASATAGTRR